MIKWRSGLGGFVGASKSLAKGFIQQSYNLATAVIPDPKATFGVSGDIDENGQGLEITMNTDGQGINVEQIESIGLSGIISSTGQGFKIPMDTTGQGVIGEIIS